MSTAAAALVSGTVVTGSDGTATIGFPARRSKLTILPMPDSDQVVAVVASWVTDANGNYTGTTVKTYKLVPSLSTTSATAVTGVSATTTVVSNVSTTTASVLTGASLSTEAAPNVAVFYLILP